MRKLLSILLLLPFLFTPVLAETGWGPVIKKVQSSVVLIEFEDGGCSGFVINTQKKYIQTAAHCFAGSMWVDKVAATVVSKDSQKDLMILEAKELDPAKTALKLATKDPEIGDDVMSGGYGYVLLRPFFRKAMVSDDGVMIDGEGPFIGVDSGFIGGQSGGPVVNEAGEVVMIVQRASDKLGVGVAASVIRDRVGRFYQ